MAVFPSLERDTEKPCSAFPTTSEATSFGPCWVHPPPLLAKTQAAPALPLSPYPPTMAVLPSPERATDQPSSSPPTPPEPTSLPPSVQTPPLLVQTHAAPAPPLLPIAPTMAVLPSV